MERGLGGPEKGRAVVDDELDLTQTMERRRNMGSVARLGQVGITNVR
jgi:hypothetical protein